MVGAEMNAERSVMTPLCVQACACYAEDAMLNYLISGDRRNTRLPKSGEAF